MQPRLLALCLLAALITPGCVNTLALVSKVFIGDPMQPSAFKMATGNSLSKSEKNVLLYCSSPPLVSDQFGALSTDLQQELIQRMKRHDILVMNSDAGTDVIDRIGRFDPEIVGAEIENVDYVMHVQIDGFTLLEPNSTTLYRSRSSGTVTGYEVRKEEDGTKTVIQVFEQNFATEYPPNHPIPKEQTPRNVFERRAIDALADSLGASFYDVYLTDLYAR